MFCDFFYHAFIMFCDFYITFCDFIMFCDFYITFCDFFDCFFSGICLQ